MQQPIRAWAEASTYGVEDIRVSGVEQVGQPLLDGSDHLGPHRVHQEIITRHRVGSVAEPTRAEQSHAAARQTGSSG